jgi:cysteine dioxygenase
MRAYESNAAHWSKYAHANPEKQYTRNLVCEVPGLFNLLLLVWTPGKKSPVHDHADAHCLMKVLRGEILETRYAIPNFPGLEGPLVRTSSVPYGTGKVSYMADSVRIHPLLASHFSGCVHPQYHMRSADIGLQLGLHSVSNPHPTEYAVSLHRKYATRV